MSDPVVIIGANEFQLPLVLKAKQMGYSTHVFAWADGAVAAPFADRFYPISITETDKILDICRQISPKAVASIGSDLAAITVNKLANALGLPSNPEETAYIATNKYAMRRAFLNAGVPAPAFAGVVSFEEAKEAVSGFRFPIIVKPTDRSGSRGITKLESLSGLESAVELAVSQSFEKRAIVEEFAEGHEFSCECISQNGVHHMLAVTKKFTTGAPHFIETGHIQPSGLDEDRLKAVKKAVFAALDALKITTGASHAEFKLLPDTGEVFIIEVGARMGGDCIGSDLVPVSTGYDFTGMVLKAALGLPVVPEKEVSSGCPRACPGCLETEKYAAIRFIFNRSDLELLKMIEADPELSKRLVRVSEIAMGEDNAVSDSSSRFGFYILCCGSLEEAKRLANLYDNEEC